MATEIVRWCDRHLATKDERVPGESWSFQITSPSGGNVTASVDACPDCAAPYAELVEYLREHGTPGGPMDTGPVARASSVRRSPRPATVGTDTSPPIGKAAYGKPAPPCPVCGFQSSSKAALQGHLREHHNTDWFRAFGLTPPLTCDLCGWGCATGTGLAAHLRITHPDHASGG
jgi:hypothetical protein